MNVTSRRAGGDDDSRAPLSGTRRLLLIALALLVVVPLACSGDDAAVGDAQPAPNAPLFKPGSFDEIPLYSGSEEAGPRTEDGDVISQSYFVNGANPQLIIDFYRSELDGWELSERRDVGKAITAQFTEPGENGDVLEVSATEVDNDGADATETSQYSLVLHTGAN